MSRSRGSQVALTLTEPARPATLAVSPLERKSEGLSVPAKLISTGSEEMAWFILVVAGLFEVGWAIG